MEYAIEAVALFNPSIVPALIQEGAPPGGLRFLMSLRATGEGHLSSIVFRTGIIDAAGDVAARRSGAVQPDAESDLARRVPQVDLSPRPGGASGFPKSNFKPILDRLGERFTRDQLSEAIEAERQARGIIGVSGIEHRLADLGSRGSTTSSIYRTHLSARRPRS